MLPLLFLISFSLMPLVVQCQTCSGSDAQVLILGGGMTGVAAANRFHELGITDFVILESQSKLGGRVRTEEISPGVNVNVGASWIQGVDPAAPRLNPIFDLAVRCGGLEGMYSDYDNLTVYNSSGYDISDSNRLRYDDYTTASDNSVTQSEEIAARGMPDISVREALTTAGWVPSTPEDHFVEWFSFDFCFAEPPDVSSLFRDIDISIHTDFLQSPENYGQEFFITDNRGTPFLIDCLANNFTNNDPSNDPRIHLNTNVTRIEYNNDCVCATAVRDGESEEYCAPYAIVSFSINVVKRMEFSPPLPDEKMNALSLIVMADYLILYAVYDVPRFWDNNEFVGHVHPNRGYFPIFQPLHGSHGINGLSFTFTDENARRIAQADEASIKQEITQVLRAVYRNNAIPEPSTILFMDWGSDPSFLGMFINLRPGSDEASANSLISPEGGMYIAGEGTSFKYSGTILGASTSGINTANEIAEKISSQYKLVSNAQLVFIVAACIVILH